MNNLELKKAEVKIERLKYIVGTLEQTEEFIKNHQYTEREWKYRLSQSQDVTRWIHNPNTINIRSNLEDLSGFLKDLKQDYYKILDIGCYAGYIYDYIKEYIYKEETLFHYTGIDIREDAIESAREIHKNNRNCNFLVGNIYKLDKKIYDIVICSRVLIHLPKIEELISNLLNISKLGLFLVIKTGETSCSLNRLTNIRTDDSMLYFYRSISIKDLQSIAINNNANLVVLQNNSLKYSSIVFTKEEKR